MIGLRWELGGGSRYIEHTDAFAMAFYAEYFRFAANARWMAAQAAGVPHRSVRRGARATHRDARVAPRQSRRMHTRVTNHAICTDSFLLSCSTLADHFGSRQRWARLPGLLVSGHQGCSALPSRASLAARVLNTRVTSRLHPAARVVSLRQTTEYIRSGFAPGRAAPLGIAAPGRALHPFLIFLLNAEANFIR